MIRFEVSNKLSRNRKVRTCSLAKQMQVLIVVHKHTTKRASGKEKHENYGPIDGQVEQKNDFDVDKHIPNELQINLLFFFSLTGASGDAVLGFVDFIKRKRFD